MLPGLPALVVLVIATLVGVVAGFLATCGGFSHGASKAIHADRDLGSTDRRHHVVFHACVIGVVAAVFLLWAIWLCCTVRFDLGVISFACALVAAYSGFRLWHHDGSVYHDKWHGFLVLFACLMVAMNYLLALMLCYFRFIVGPWSLAFYFAVGFFWWLVAAALGYYFATKAQHPVVVGSRVERPIHVDRPLVSDSYRYRGGETRYHTSTYET
eukprot:TRINITY_DN44149_c0_g1_i1.p1 TRINITY_DN44149_c0_g1~~TRINITY_DN44149_c0_g1_i1.p1  ORF type:complete len:213 (+),score=15.16 TRINITY_DN44149_c0_g1_i1:62-700(+)